MSIKELEPKLIWKHFYNITQIPHCSKNEAGIINYLEDFAMEIGLNHRKDDVGNVVITKEATSEMYKKNPTLVLQGHMDMVCEKNSDISFDFINDPLNLLITDDGWVTANGTTLGADNGIGVAAALAILESNDLEHGKIEALFTVDEETGMNGVLALTEEFVSGRTLLNLDTEEEGAIYIGCAGGGSTILSKEILELEENENLAGYKKFKLGIDGLQGGHSGLMIDQELGNAVKLLARILWNMLNRSDIDYKISSINGGDKHNAIPREASSIIYVNENSFNKLEKIVSEFNSIYKNEFKIADGAVRVYFEELEIEANNAINVLTSAEHHKILDLLYSFPHGVMAQSKVIEGLVETSTNLASVKMINDNKGITIQTSQRSSVASSITDICDKIVALGNLAGMKAEIREAYPSWQPDKDSKILKIASDKFVKMYNFKPKIKAIHAGLECGILSSIYKDMDMISFGPNITGAHSPDEQLEIASTKKFWEFLVEVIKL